MSWGGRRPGAGRPRKSEKYKGKIAKAEKRIADRLPWLIDRQFVLAEGVSLVQTRKEIQAAVQMLQANCQSPEAFEAAVEKLKTLYVVLPHRQAIEYLLNRIMGKPTERVEQDTSVSGDIKGIIVTRLPKPDDSDSKS